MILTTPLSIRMTQSITTFHNLWWSNRGQIVALAAINTSITTGTEFVSRTAFAPVAGDKEKNKFFLPTDSGSYRIHRQSLINILMTVFASLFGGPVFFMRKGWHRFLFFVGFGGFNSVLCQMIAGFSLITALPYILKRLAFDLSYCATVKFFVFEWGRLPIVAASKLRRLWVIRIIQDTVLTSCKVIILNALKFVG